jgi:HlyD family secretion protein
MAMDATSTPPFYKLTRRRFGTACFVAAVCATGLFVNYARDRLAALPELRTVKMQHRNLRLAIGTIGTIEPAEVVEVGALVSGTIIGFAEDPTRSLKPIEVGTRVAKGTTLARLDPQLYQVELRKAQAAERLSAAEVGRLETQLQQAKRDLERAQRLRATNSESVFDEVVTAYETAQADLAISQARREQASSEVQQAEVNLARTTISSPIAGIVIDSRVNLGQNVNPSNSGLFLLAHDLDHMQIRASVSETDIGKVHQGQPVSFTVDSHGERVFSGQVDRILLNARVQSNFVTYDVLIAITGTTEMLLPHMTADVEFEIEQRQNAWLVPGESLRWWPSDEQIADSTERTAPAEGATDLPAPQEGDRAHVWVPTGDGRVRSIRVRVGIDDGVQTEVIGDGFRDEMPVVVGTIRETTLARIIPSVKTLR